LQNPKNAKFCDFHFSTFVWTKINSNYIFLFAIIWRILSCNAHCFLLS
jgi:hypothetical protein